MLSLFIPHLHCIYICGWIIKRIQPAPWSQNYSGWCGGGGPCSCLLPPVFSSRTSNANYTCHSMTYQRWICLHVWQGHCMCVKEQRSVHAYFLLCPLQVFTQDPHRSLTKLNLPGLSQMLRSQIASKEASKRSGHKAQWPQPVVIMKAHSSGLFFIFSS